MQKPSKSAAEPLFSEERIRAFLGGRALPIFIYDEISSTSDAAKAYALAGGKSAVFIAERQTAGRGRRGRSFSSPEGGGIYMSLLVFPSHKAEQGVLLTTGAAVAMCRAVEDVTGIVPEIKWVNDLKLGGKKLCGILTEGELDPESGAFRYAVIGIGINVKKVPLPPEVEAIATSLDRYAKAPIDRDFLAARMILRVLESLSEDRAAQMKKYRALCPIEGKEILVLRGDEKYTARAVRVEDDGALLIEREGRRERLSSGEISIRENKNT